MDSIKDIRFEVIDDDGRQYVQYGVDIAFSFQDNDKTLKIFVKKNKEKEVSDLFPTNNK